MIALKNYGSILYNLNSDLRETTDVSQKNEKEFNKLNAAYNAWETELEKPLWDEGELWMGVTYHIHKQLMENKEPEYKDIWSPAFKGSKQKNDSK